MNRMEELIEVFSNVMGIDKSMVDDVLSRDNYESWDSFNHLLLFSEIEKTTGVRFTVSEIEGIKNFKMLREAYKEKLK